MQLKNRVSLWSTKFASAWLWTTNFVQNQGLFTAVQPEAGPIPHNNKNIDFSICINLINFNNYPDFFS